MFLIPIGHEESGVRRLPAVTLGVMAICVVALILSSGVGFSSDADERVHARFEEALEYYFAHPYLELSPEFAELAAAETGNDLAPLMEYYGSGIERPDRAIVLTQQPELDRLMARVVESLSAHPFFRFGLVPAEFSVLGLITHMFMHAGWLHLIGNLLMLYLAGPYVEDVWGRPLFAAFYLVAGIIAALSFVALNPDLEAPLVGASGAVAGVMGAFLVRYWKTRIRFFYMIGILVRGTFWAPAWLMLPLWLGAQLFMVAITSGAEGQGGVAYWAHIGGFLFGAGLAWFIQTKRIEARYIDAAIEQKAQATVLDNRAVDEALSLHENGRGETALKMLLQEVQRSPSNRDAALALWSVALDLDLCIDAGPAMVRVIREELRVGDCSEALRCWKEVSARLPKLKIGPALCARLAQALHTEREPGPATAMLRRALLEAGSSVTPALAFQIARIGEEIDRPTAIAALRLASGRPDLDPESREQIEQLLVSMAPRPVSTA
jgi:membrane associated rhomboid family serine protease